MIENTCQLYDLLEKHRQNAGIIKTRKIAFSGVDGHDVYNISSEFSWNGTVYIAGRVEQRHTEISTVRFFEKTGDGAYKVTPLIIANLQDPFVEKIDGQLLIGGTEIYPDGNGFIHFWHTVFYYGPSIDQLTKIIEAPIKMKDVRIAKGDRYYVMSRPQGGHAAWGKIGFTMADALTDITSMLIEEAPLIEDLFGAKCWGGANQIHCLRNGWLGVLGHVAVMSEGDVRHYYGMTFAIHPVTRARTPMKIICERNDFAPGASKRPDLIDVVFVGGLVRQPDNTAVLYTGLSDAEAHYAVIEDPFLEYEELK